jgi:hypothetical protein
LLALNYLFERKKTPSVGGNTIKFMEIFRKEVGQISFLTALAVLILGAFPNGREQSYIIFTSSNRLT